MFGNAKDRRLSRVGALVAVASSLGLGACSAAMEGPESNTSLSQELTVRFEGETQSWSTSSGDSVSASSSNARLQANASGDTFSFTDSVSSGTYTVVVRYAKRNVYGNYSVQVNGTQVGTLSGFSSSTSDVWNTATLGSVSLSGNTSFRFVSTGKDSASSDFDIKIDYVEIQSSSGSTSGSGGSGSSSGGAGSSSGGAGSSSGGSTSSGSPPSCTIPSASSTQSVSSTIQVSGTFDGGMKRYVGSGSLATSSQSESQGPIFNLAAGATLKNVILGNPAADGVHCNGNCTLQNVYWEDVGEDAATQKGSSSSEVMTINGGVARSASDKIFQHNGPGKMVIQNFCAQTFGKLYRSCGNCSHQFKRDVVIDNVLVTGGKVVAGINTNYGDTARFSRIFVSGTAPTICEKYTGNDTGAEPPAIGSGADGVNCIYSSSDIIKE